MPLAAKSAGPKSAGPTKAERDALAAARQQGVDKALKNRFNPAIPWRPAKSAANPAWAATTCVASGPIIDRPVVAGSNDCWFELHPAANSTMKDQRFDTADVTFVVQLMKVRSRTGREANVLEHGKVSFSPSPPVLPHRPHGSIHVLLSSLRTAGRYYLHVVRDGSDIRGSPFTITIDPGPPAELRLIGRHGHDAAVPLDATGEGGADRPNGGGGTAAAAVPAVEMCAGESSSLVFRAYDQCGNAVPHGGASIQIQMRLATTTLQTEINDRSDGTYELTACSDVVGTYECRVALMAAPEGGAGPHGRRRSAFGADAPPPPEVAVHRTRLSFVVNAAAPHPPSCRLLGFPSRLRAGEAAACQIEARDVCGNRIPYGGASWRLRLERRGEPTASEASEAYWEEADYEASGMRAPGGGRASTAGRTGPLFDDGVGFEPTSWSLVDLGDGTYEARLTVERAGSFDVTLVADFGDASHAHAGRHPPARHHHANAGHERHAYELHVEPGPLVLTMSDLSGKGMLHATAGVATRATLRLRDGFGNPTAGPSADEIASMLQLRAALVSDAKAPYGPKGAAHRDRVPKALRERAEMVYGLGSPKRSNGRPAASAGHSAPSARGGASSSAHSAPMQWSSLPFELVPFRGTPGCYRLAFALERAGDWRLDARYDGVELRIPSAPLAVEPAPLCVENCLVLDATSDNRPPRTTCAAGHVWSARLQLRDRFGNPVALGKRRVTGKLVGGTAGGLVKRSGDKLAQRALPPDAPSLPLEVVSVSDTAAVSGGAAKGGAPSQAARARGGNEVVLRGRPVHHGPYCCSMWVDGASIPAALLWVDVHAALASAQASAMLSPMGTTTMRALVPVVVHVALRDECGNACEQGDGITCAIEPEGAATVEVGRAAAVGDPVPVTLTPRQVGGCQLHVAVFGVPLRGSPFPVRVAPGGASAEQCVALNPEEIAVVQPGAIARLRVRMHDALGHPVPHGGAALHAILAPSGPKLGAVLSVDDHANGSYTIAFKGGLSARYSLLVTVDGAPIQGSPFVVDVPLHEAADGVRATPRPAARGLSQRPASPHTARGAGRAAALHSSPTPSARGPRSARREAGATTHAHARREKLDESFTQSRPMWELRKAVAERPRSAPFRSWEVDQNVVPP